MTVGVPIQQSCGSNVAVCCQTGDSTVSVPSIQDFELPNNTDSLAGKPHQHRAQLLDHRLIIPTWREPPTSDRLLQRQPPPTYFSLSSLLFDTVKTPLYEFVLELRSYCTHPIESLFPRFRAPRCYFSADLVSMRRCSMSQCLVYSGSWIASHGCSAWRSYRHPKRASTNGRLFVSLAAWLAGDVGNRSRSLHKSRLPWSGD
jgi:hypothetical protein